MKKHSINKCSESRKATKFYIEDLGRQAINRLEEWFSDCSTVCVRNRGFSTEDIFQYRSLNVSSKDRPESLDLIIIESSESDESIHCFETALAKLLTAIKYEVVDSEGNEFAGLSQHASSIFDINKILNSEELIRTSVIPSDEGESEILLSNQSISTIIFSGECKPDYLFAFEKTIALLLAAHNKTVTTSCCSRINIYGFVECRA